MNSRSKRKSSRCFALATASFLIGALTWVDSVQASALPCGPILKKAKTLPKKGNGKAECVLVSHIPGDIRGSSVSEYLCDNGKTKYELTTYEDLSCEAKKMGAAGKKK